MFNTLLQAGRSEVIAISIVNILAIGSYISLQLGTCFIGLAYIGKVNHTLIRLIDIGIKLIALGSKVFQHTSPPQIHISQQSMDALLGELPLVLAIGTIVLRSKSEVGFQRVDTIAEDGYTRLGIGIVIAGFFIRTNGLRNEGNIAIGPDEIEII